MTVLRLAVWDVDGTIVDSRDVIQSAMELAFRARGLAPPSYAATRHVVGLDLAEAVSRLAPPDLGTEGLEELVNAYKAAFIDLRSRPGFREPLYDGARETLAALKEAGWTLTIATGKSRRGLAALFDAHPIRDYFAGVWCADDGPGKPHPFMIEQALDAFGVPPSGAAMIGDAVHDMAMARTAGVLALGVSWGFGEAAELRAAGAHEVHDDFAGLAAALAARRHLPLS